MMEVTYAGLAKRIQSIFIDSLLMLIMMFFVAWALDSIYGSSTMVDEDDEAWIKAVLFICIWGVYEPVSMVIGCTVGNYLMKIRVRRFANAEKKINIFQAYIRFIIKFLLGWLSFLTIGFNKEKRAIHDLAAGTIVIEKN